MEEHGGLQSMGSQRVGHDWATSLSLYDILRTLESNPLIHPLLSHSHAPDASVYTRMGASWRPQLLLPIPTQSLLNHSLFSWSRQLCGWGQAAENRLGCGWMGGQGAGHCLGVTKEDWVGLLGGKFYSPNKVIQQACSCLLLSSAWKTDITGRDVTVKPHAWAPKPTHHHTLMMAEKKWRKTLGSPWQSWIAGWTQPFPISLKSKSFAVSIVWGRIVLL